MFAKRELLLPIVETVAEINEVSTLLLDAIVATESSYDRYAMRYEPTYSSHVLAEGFARENNITIETERQLHKFSFGLCQIMGGTARSLGFKGPLTQLLDPETNLTMACSYISMLTNRYPNDVRDVISGYNAGTPKMYVNGKYRNQAYVDKVLNFIKVLGELKNDAKGADRLAKI